MGCFGLTELGYGNNAVQMETTATYDKDTKEFIVNTPTPLAQKYWITNGACHAHHIIVFSQLYIDGVNQGNDLHGTLSIFCCWNATCMVSDAVIAVVMFSSPSSFSLTHWSFCPPFNFFLFVRIVALPSLFLSIDYKKYFMNQIIGHNILHHLTNLQ